MPDKYNFQARLDLSWMAFNVYCGWENAATLLLVSEFNNHIQHQSKNDIPKVPST